MKTFDINKLIRPNIMAMQAYRSARSEYSEKDDTLIFLDANENPYDNGLNRYPDPHQTELKSKLSKAKHVATDHILLGNGSDEILDLLFRAFCEPKIDNIITLTPTYGMYDVLANLNDIENREVPLNATFKPVVDEVLSVVNKNSKIVFICSPNNPSGNTFSEMKIERLLTEFSGLVVIDEAYIDFSDKASWLKRLEEFPNLVITQTMSKAYGMAGIRLGICYASPDIIKVLKKIKPPYNVNELTQQRAIKRLANMSRVKTQIKNIKENKLWLEEKLQDFRCVKQMYPSDANFILVKFDDANLRYKQLKTKGVIVRNRSNIQGCENMLRITIGSMEDNKEVIRILKLNIEKS
jgi:histidinol-phosphate aminotransferase